MVEQLPTILEQHSFRQSGMTQNPSSCSLMPLAPLDLVLGSSVHLVEKESSTPPESEEVVLLI